MPKMTVLDMTQDILNDMDSDEIDSIDDTAEAWQVAQILKTTYYEILSSRDWPHLQGLLTLETQGDNAKPTHVTIPDNVTRIEWVKYNKRQSADTKDKFQKVKWKEPEEFLSMINTRDSSDSTIDTVNDPTSNYSLFILNDTAPTYWTSFDDETMIFDSYDSDVDSTIQLSKLQAWGTIEPSFSLVDGFTPDLPSKAFAYYLSEAKSTAFNALRQSPNQKEEQRSRRQRTWLARNSVKQNGGSKAANYGRAPKK